jgi:hypothetical protein
MTTNFQFAQAPNRKGNKSTRPVNSNTGVTAVTNTKHGVETPKGSQGAPAYSRQTDNTNAGATGGRGQKVMVDTHADYCGHIKNDGYMDQSVKNYLK